MESLPPNPANPSDIPSPSNQYVINNVQQLFELNPNLVNFRANFMVKSLSNEPFMGLVINQQTLDSGNMPEFKSADQGYFSGEITQDNNLYTNWYLALKSQKPNKVVIQIQSMAIPPREAMQDPYGNLEHHPYGHAPQGQPHMHPPLKEGYGSYLSMNNLMTVVGVAAAATACYLAYKYYKERSLKPQPMNPIAASLMPPLQSLNKPVMSMPQVSNPLPVVSNPPVAAAAAAGPISPLLPMKSPARMDVSAIHSSIPSTPTNIEVPPSLNLGGSSTGDILGSDLMKQINNLPNI
ncbi:hypothetical protein EBU71_23110 [bacterium]|nr:hypothetical protein [Candidatus Elulimicrobium humile]